MPVGGSAVGTFVFPSYLLPSSFLSERSTKRCVGELCARTLALGGPAVCRQGASFRVCRPQSSPAAWWCSPARARWLLDFHARISGPECVLSVLHRKN